MEENKNFTKEKEEKEVTKEFTPDYVGYENGEMISGYTIKEQPDCITVIVKFYKESEKNNTVAKMTELLRRHDFQKRVYIVNGDEFIKEMRKYNVDDSKFDDFGQQTILVELTDLVTGMYVPIKIVLFK